MGIKERARNYGGSNMRYHAMLMRRLEDIELSCV